MNTRIRSQWRRGGIFNLITPSCTIVGFSFHYNSYTIPDSRFGETFFFYILDFSKYNSFRHDQKGEGQKFVRCLALMFERALGFFVRVIYFFFKTKIVSCWYIMITKRSGILFQEIFNLKTIPLLLTFFVCWKN